MALAVPLSRGASFGPACVSSVVRHSHESVLIHPELSLLRMPQSVQAADAAHRLWTLRAIPSPKGLVESSRGGRSGAASVSPMPGTNGVRGAERRCSAFHQGQGVGRAGASAHEPNQITSLDAAMTITFHADRQSRGASECFR
jgi:hypothetical protein